MTLIDGTATAKAIKEEIKQEVSQLTSQGHRAPKLVAILVGEDGASQTYVNAKAKACDFVGFSSEVIRLAADTSESELLDKVQEINEDVNIDGLIVQLPLPKHIDERKVTETIAWEKDVDGFHPVNVGKMFKNLPCFLPATPFGIIQLLERYEIETSGKHCVVIGRSDIVGKPMSALMARNSKTGNCTVTLCHSRTQNLSSYSSAADILIVALGKPEFVTADMVKPGAVVIDVGITRVDAPDSSRGYVLKGDVKFDEVAPKCSYITPVPKGVGPMTIVSLLRNTLQATKQFKGIA